MTRRLVFLTLSAFVAGSVAKDAEARNQAPPLLPRQIVAALAQEVSGENGHRVVQQLSQWHRMRGSQGFAAAVDHIHRKLKDYGLEEVEVWSFPADGEIFYGTQRSRPACTPSSRSFGS